MNGPPPSSRSRRGPPSLTPSRDLYDREVRPQWTQHSQSQTADDVHSQHCHPSQSQPLHAPQSSSQPMPMAMDDGGGGGGGDYRRSGRRRPNYNNDNSSNNRNHNHYSQPSIMPDHHTSRNSGSVRSHGRNSNSNNGDDGRNNNNNSRKRAAKRRVKHDLPGPSGAWFRQQKQKTAAKQSAAFSTRKAKSEAKVKDHGVSMKIMKPDGVQSNAEIRIGEKGNAQQSQQTGSTSTLNKDDDEDNSDTTPSSESKKQQQKHEQQQQLFHDHSADLHECNAWNLMCTSLHRIVPTPTTMLITSYTTNNAASTYKRALRRNVPNNYALIHEIHEGKFDRNRLGFDLWKRDLNVNNLLVGYVASVQCHAHSDWTALLVDEMHSVSNSNNKNGYSGKGNSGVGRGIVCWLEERLVKQHAGWVRPGAVWMLEGAKLALFASSGDDSDNDGGDNDGNGPSGNDGHGNVAAAGAASGTDVSPSTDAARGGGSIDRQLLVGESSVVYAWTPEEANSTFTHEEFIDLTAQRLDLGMPEDVVEIDGGSDGDSVAGNVTTIGPMADDATIQLDMADNASRAKNAFDPSSVVPKSPIAHQPSAEKTHSPDTYELSNDDLMTLLAANDDDAVALRNNLNNSSDQVIETAKPQNSTTDNESVEKPALEAGSSSTQTNLTSTCEKPVSRTVTPAESAHIRRNAASRRPNPYANQMHNAKHGSSPVGNARNNQSSLSSPSNPYTKNEEGEGVELLGISKSSNEAAGDENTFLSTVSANSTEKGKKTQSRSKVVVSQPNPIVQKQNPKQQGVSTMTNEQMSGGDGATELPDSSNKALTRQTDLANAKKDRDTGRNKSPTKDRKLPPDANENNKLPLTSKSTAPHSNPYAKQNHPKHVDLASIPVAQKAQDANLSKISNVKSTSPRKNDQANAAQSEATEDDDLLRLLQMTQNKSPPAAAARNISSGQLTRYSSDKVPVQPDATRKVAAQVQSNDSFDDMLDENDDILEAVTAKKNSHLTPKDLEKPNPQVQMKLDTGDSFDDMLDEDDDEMLGACAGTTIINTEPNSSATLSNANALFARSTSIVKVDSALPLGSAPNASIKDIAITPTQAPSQYDSLDGDDLDLLGEDD